MAGENDGGGPDFASLIPQEYKGHPTLAPYKDMAGLLKSHIELNGMIGKNRFSMPDEKAAPEAWNEFFGKIGRPETPDKYGLKKPTDFPEGLDLPEPYLNFLTTTFHKHGLSTRQAQGLFSDLNGFASSTFKEDVTKHQSEFKAEEDALKAEFGQAYPKKVEFANRAKTAFLGEKGQRFLASFGLDNHPQMVRILAQIGEKLGEDSAEGGGGGGNSFLNMTPAQAQSEINTLTADEDFMKKYMDRYAIGHDEAVNQMTNLYKCLSTTMEPSE